MSNRRKKRPSAPLWRIVLVLGAFAVAAVAVVGRAGYLQLLHKDRLQSEGKARYLRTVEVPAHRGMLLDRNGEPLAVSTAVESAWAEPKTLLAHGARISELAAAIGSNGQELEQSLRRRGERQFAYLKRHVRPQEAARIRALHIPGVGLRREFRRYYPTAEVSGQLLGYTDIDDHGQEGLELAYDEWLRGRPGAKRVLRDRYGRTIKDIASVRVSEPGKDLYLSIDRRVQYLSYKALKTAVLKHRARGGMVLIMDARTAELLAVVNQPAANPNNRGARVAGAQRNRAVTDLFEPGSTLKPFTVMAALETRSAAPQTAVDTSPGRVRIGRSWVRDVRNFGVLDVGGVLRKSSNVGISKLALSLPHGALWSLLSDVGFGDATGIGFPGERGGHLSHFTAWSRFETATHAFGYGLSTSTLQLAQAYATIAADGVHRSPSLIRVSEASPGNRVVSAATARAVRRMMEAVVADDGTAPRARVPGYRVAGKTGTVKKSTGRGYQEDRYLALFAGMVPASRPRLVAVVVIDDPRGEEYYGGQVAAPVFAEIMTGALRLLNVPPDSVPEPPRDGTIVAARDSSWRKK